MSGISQDGLCEGSISIKSQSENVYLRISNVEEFPGEIRAADKSELSDDLSQKYSSFNMVPALSEGKSIRIILCHKIFHEIRFLIKIMSSIDYSLNITFNTEIF